MRKFFFVLAVFLAIVLTIAILCVIVIKRGNEAPAHVHTEGEWIVDVEPTCTAPGRQHKTCTTCGNIVTEALPALGHVYNHVTISPTCTERGYTLHTCARCGNSYSDAYESALGHSYSHATIPPTCTEQGYTLHTCAQCGDSYSDAYESALGHLWNAGTVIEEPTAVLPGVKTYTCIHCGTVKTESIPKLEITQSYTRVDQNENEDANGDYLLFGFYPQSEVTDWEITVALNAKAGSLPTASSPRSWTSFAYYLDGSVADYMWYRDVAYRGETYRGVYFTSYRLAGTTEGFFESATYQKDNGYVTGKVYWFRFEPLKWRILSEKNGKALLFCENIIDGFQYYKDYEARAIDDGTVYPSNYEYSDLRAWLNGAFYETAFNSLQQALIETTTVENGVLSANPKTDVAPSEYSNEYVCADTMDKIFLLSEQEATDMTYGFQKNYSSFDKARQKPTTDYAKAQGVWEFASGMFQGNGEWWLRSPDSEDSRFAKTVNGRGYAASAGFVDSTHIGVVPALQIRL